MFRRFRPASSCLLACLSVAVLACQGQDTVIVSEADAAQEPSDAAPRRLVDRIAPVDAEGAHAVNVSEPLASSASVVGSVADISFQPTHAIVLRGQIQFADRPFATIFVASDVPDMCAHLQRGSLPAGGTILAMALIRPDGKAPAAGDNFVPGAEQGAVPSPMVHAFFRKLDNQCRIDPLLQPHGATAQAGEVRLDHLDAMGGALRLDLGLGFDDLEDELLGRLQGSLQGPVCDAPKLFDHAETLFEGTVEDGLCL